MPRRKRSTTAPKPEPAPLTKAAKPMPLITIHPSDVFSHQGLLAALDLPKSCLAREVRLRRLRVSRRSGKYYFLGAWVLEWLRDGELHRKRRSADEQPAA